MEGRSQSRDDRRSIWNEFQQNSNAGRARATAGFGLGLLGYVYEQYCGAGTPITTPYVHCMRRVWRVLCVCGGVLTRVVSRGAAGDCLTASGFCERTVSHERDVRDSTLVDGRVLCGSRLY
jgi:hypothetical protein